MKCEIGEKPAKLMFRLVVTAEGLKNKDRILLLYLFEMRKTKICL
jgi:hypothetical protein